MSKQYKYIHLQPYIVIQVVFFEHNVIKCMKSIPPTIPQVYFVTWSYSPLCSSPHAISLGPLGTISRVPNPLAACDSRTRFPMNTSDNTQDHMHLCIAIVQHNRPNLGRFALIASITLMCPLYYMGGADVSTTCVLCAAALHGSPARLFPTPL